MPKDQAHFSDGLLEFLKASPTPFHAVSQLKAMLVQGGFTELVESQSWNLKAGGKYFTTRGGSALVAWCQGDSPVDHGLRLVGAHTDSPCLHLKPECALTDRNYVRLGVEVYGGVLLSTWFDRDLGIAGRVFYRTQQGAVADTLICTDRAVATIPNLAIHLNRSANENRTIQKQAELPALFAHAAAVDSLDSVLLAEIKRAGREDAQTILSHELCLYDTAPPARVGWKREFIASSRLDNLLSCYTGAQALLHAQGPGTAVLICNDHEEVGSASATGAQGPFLRSTLERMTGGGEAFARSIARSVLFSTDNSHAVHPNYPDKHDTNHGPVLNGGPAVKINANQHYATTAHTLAWARDCAERAKVSLQSFVSRNDMPCGSTIGPITASVLGVATVDLGVPTFAMHSIRELAGSEDAEALSRLLVAFYNHPGLG